MHWASAVEVKSYQVCRAAMESYNRRSGVDEKDRQFRDQVELLALTCMRKSVVHSVELMILNAFAHCRHPLQARDRLGNPNIDFPIGVAYGEFDSVVDSVHTDTIIKNNKHFASGRSQLFQIKGCPHQTIMSKPEETLKVVFGFFDGTLKGHFEETITVSKILDKGKRISKL